MGNADLHRLPQRFVADAQGVISPHGGILQWVFGPPNVHPGQHRVQGDQGKITELGWATLPPSTT